MPNSGDIVDLDLGIPAAHGAGFRHPGIVVTAQRILDHSPSVVHVVPLASKIPSSESEIVLEPDHVDGLRRRSAAQCQHLRAVSSSRILDVRGNVGPAALAQVQDTIGVILDLP